MQYGVYCLAFWFGSTQVVAGTITFEDMLIAFLSVFHAAFGLAQVGCSRSIGPRMGLVPSSSACPHPRVSTALPSLRTRAQTPTAFPHLAKAKAAVQRVFAIIDR